MIGDDGEDTGIDWDNTDLGQVPIDPDRTQPFEPEGTSTPAGGESIPMTTRTSLSQERGPRTKETSFTTPPDLVNSLEINLTLSKLVQMVVKKES